jgi:hypothetical protein
MFCFYYSYEMDNLLYGGLTFPLPQYDVSHVMFVPGGDSEHSIFTEKIFIIPTKY